MPACPLPRRYRVTGMLCVLVFLTTGRAHSVSTTAELLQKAEQELHQTPWKCIDAANQALVSAVDERDRVGEGKAHLLLGNARLDMNHTDTALEHLLTARDIFRELGLKGQEAESLQRLGALFQGLVRCDEALNYYNQSLNIFVKLGESRGIARVYNSFGVCYWYQKDYGKALEFYQKALAEQRGLDDPIGLSATLNNIGMIQEVRGKPVQALDYYNQSLALKRPIGYSRGIAATLGNMGETYLNLGQLDVASRHLEESMKIAEQNQNMDILANSLESLAEVREKQGSLRQAIALMKQWTDLKEQIHQKQAGDKITSIQMLNEMERKEASIRLLEQKNEIQELTISKQRTVYRMLFLSIVLLSCFVAALLTVFVVRHRKNRIIQAQYRDLQQAMDRITLLKGLLPICANCKNVRDDKGYWIQVEQYVSEHSDVTFSHGICPVCAEKLYGDLMTRKDKKG